MRRLVPTLLSVLLLCLCASAAAAAVAPGAEQDAAAGSAVEIEFADAAGNVRDVPYFDIAAAYPGMEAQFSTVTVANSGSVPVLHVLEVVMGTASGASLDDVLVVTVRDDAGAVVDRGRLSDLKVEADVPLSPGQRATYRLDIAWPDGGDGDNAYMGATLDFTVRAHGVEA